MIYMILFIVCTSFENQLLKDLMNSHVFFFLHRSDIAKKQSGTFVIRRQTPTVTICKMLSRLYLPSEVHNP